MMMINAEGGIHTGNKREEKEKRECGPDELVQWPLALQENGGPPCGGQSPMRMGRLSAEVTPSPTNHPRGDRRGPLRALKPKTPPGRVGAEGGGRRRHWKYSWLAHKDLYCLWSPSHCLRVLRPPFPSLPFLAYIHTHTHQTIQTNTVYAWRCNDIITHARTGVAALALGLKAREEARAGVHHLRLLDHEPVLHQLFVRNHTWMCCGWWWCEIGASCDSSSMSRVVGTSSSSCHVMASHQHRPPHTRTNRPGNTKTHTHTPAAQ